MTISVFRGKLKKYHVISFQANFNAAENSDGKVVTGSYSVALPDGRTQHVKYTADHYNGYVAEVTYEGVPVYPDTPAYKPAPAYAPGI